MTKISEITECSECGSKSLTWGTHYKTNSGVPEGRLRSSEVQCLFVLGCDECSETLAIVSADKVAAALSAQQSAPERGDEWIPVSERLPDVAQEVIVDSEFDGVTAGFLDSYGEWYSPNSDYKLTRVVAWQPLPAAPSLLATHRGQASGCP